MVPCFRWLFFVDMSPSETTGSLSDASTQFLHRPRWPSTICESLGTSHIPHPPIPVEESIFEAYLRFAFAYNLPTCSPPLSEQTRLAPSLRGLLHPGFQKFSHPHRRRILATGQVPLAVLTAYTR